ncbi:MAG: response regulator transcription factor [Eubacteriales bacterium]
MEEKKILIIEDEKKIARFLELELNHEGYAIHLEADGQSGLDEALRGGWDLILLDILLPRLNGIEVCRRIRQKSDVPVIMLTAKDDTTDIVTGLDNGANDYITKPFAIEELFARIRTALRKAEGTARQTGEVLSTADLTVEPARHQAKRGDTLIEMTRLEFELLLYLLKNKGIVLSRNQILENVWGFDYIGETNVVDVYINYLRNKLDRCFENKLVQTVRGVGYYIKDE